MFRRRRSEDADRDEFDNDEPEQPAGVSRAEGGPWDAEESFPVLERVDLGSLQVPIGPEHEIQLVMAEQHGAWVTIRYQESEVQIQAFAASRRGALWDDVPGRDRRRGEHGGRAEPGDRGIVRDRADGAGTGRAGPARAAGIRLVRFVGVDGPRWFVRGLFSGPAAEGGDQADLLEEVFRDVVVVRGEHPVPPREILELRLPPEARQALEEQAAAEEENRFGGDLNPFERGPEFTETR